jgi:NRPS condensation-like uncharacterized protein
VKTNSNRIPLTGGDYFVYALDRQMRSTGLQGNICRLVLRLDGLFRTEQLRSIIQSCDLVSQLAKMRMRLRFPLTTPCWFSSHPSCEVTIAEHKATLPRTESVSFCNSCVSHKLHPRKAPGFAFDLIRYRDNKTDLVLSWHHSLMDARGAESLLMQISNPKANIPLLDSESSQNDHFSKSIRSRGLLKSAKRLVYSRQSLFFIEEVHRHPLATLVPKEKGRCGNSHLYRPIYFSEAESKNIETNCEKLGAGFHRSLFILAAVTRAFHAIRIARGENFGAYVIPVPQDLRKKGITGPILSNHVTFLFYRVESEDAASIKTLITSLKQQMTEQIRSNFNSSFSSAMEMFRFLPLSYYARVLSQPSRNKMATFFFSDTGESLPNTEDFHGVPIADLYHLAPVPLPPGIAVISGWLRGRLRIVLSQVAGCLTEQEVKLFEQVIRAELLAQGQK